MWVSCNEAADTKKPAERNPPSKTGVKLAKSNTNVLSNHEVFTKLGLTRLRIPSSHSRKRLAVESRQHYNADDSKMFVIKLPPNPYYYAHTKTDSKANSKHISKKVPVGFKSNGKPGKIYHWNIPVLKKLTGQKQHSRSQLSRHDDSDIFDIQKTPTWTYNHNTNESHDKSEYLKPLKHVKKTPTYYVPAKPKKNSFMKYFSGNGRPKSFYVIEKSKKPSHFQRLLP